MLNSRLTRIVLRLSLILIVIAALAAISAPRPTVASSSAAATYPGPVPKGALARIGKGQVIGMAISPNEKRIAILTSIGVYMYDAAKMRQLWFKENYDSDTIAFSADSKRVLVMGLFQDLRAYSVESGGLIRTYKSPEGGGISNAAYSKDGKYIAATDGSAMYLLNAQSGKVIHTADVFNAEELDFWESVDTSPDNSMIALGGGLGYYVNIIDLATGTMLRRFEVNGPADLFFGVSTVRFSPNSQYLAAGTSNGMLLVWNAKTGEWLYTQQVPSGIVEDIRFSADGTQMVVSASLIYIYDLASGQIVRVYDNLPASQYRAYYSISGGVRALDSSVEGFKHWNADTGQLLAASTAHGTSIAAGEFMPDGKTLLIGRISGLLEKYTASTRERTAFFWTAPIGLDMAVSPDGTLLSLGAGEDTAVVNTLNLSNGQVVSSIDLGGAIEQFPKHLSYAPGDAGLLVGSINNTVSYWNPHTGQIQGLIDTYANQGFEVTFSRDGSQIAFWLETQVVIWDVLTGAPRLSIPLDFGEDGWFTWSSAFSQDGKLLVAASVDGRIAIWDTQTGQVVKTFNENPDFLLGFPTSLAISKDGRVLAIGRLDGKIDLWNIKTGKLIKTLTGHGAYISWIDFSPVNGQLYTAGLDGTVVIWPKP